MGGRYIFPPSCLDELFTDRDEEMEKLYRFGEEAALWRTPSVALIGLRRLGKTELFKRVHARLFFEQDAVAPVFFSFQGASPHSAPLAEEYLREFLRQYLSFTSGKDWEVLGLGLNALLDLAERQGPPFSDRIVPQFRNARLDYDEGWMLAVAFEAPRTVADTLERPIVMFLDEFELVLEVRNRDGTDPSALGKYQVAVESLRCPHIIPGSAMTLVLRDVVGSGPLYGRLMVEHIRGLHPVYGAELARRLAAFYGVGISEAMAGHLAERTDGNPFYITAVVRQAATLGVSLDVPEELNQALATDLIKGAIFSELWQQVMHFVMGENQYGVRSELVEFLAQYGVGEQISERDMELFGDKVGLGSVEVHGLFAALARADLVEEGPLGVAYSAVRDPILNEFLRVWVRVKRQSRGQLLREKYSEYQKRARRMDEYVGYVAERWVELLMTKWRGEVVSGEYFGVEGEVELPRFEEVGKERLKAPGGPTVEVDVVGWGWGQVWLVECKYWKRKVGLGEVQEFEERMERAMSAVEAEYARRWFVSKSGFAAEAEEYLRERGGVHSDGEQLNYLLQRYGLRKLPEM